VIRAGGKFQSERMTGNPEVTRVMGRNLLCQLRGSPQNLGPTWGQNQGLLGPNLGFSGSKGNRLNRTFGRGGGDRKLYYTIKSPTNSGVATAPIPTITTNTTRRNPFGHFRGSWRNEPHGCGLLHRDNPQDLHTLEVDIASRLNELLVGPQGFEPWTNGL
jgi:hypothetical protein